MDRVARFEKVSREQFFNDFIGEFPIKEMEEEQINAIYQMYDDIKLPERGTSGSAGYDFVVPFDIVLQPGEVVKIPTGIRCFIENGWVLQVVPRSSVGFKYHIMLANTIGVIDSDYYNAKNEGHIWVKLVNHGEKTFDIKAGDKICQGMFVPFGITYNDEVETERVGGIGSTGE